MRRYLHRPIACVLALALAAVAVAWTTPARTVRAAWARSTALADVPPITAAASSARGVVAVGDGIWFSGDTRTWTRVLDAAALGGRLGGQDGELTAVAPFGSGFVAAGQAVDPATEQAVAAIWISPDGQQWARVRDSDLEPATPAIPPDVTTPVRGSIHSVTRGGPGLVAVGAVFAGTFVDGTLVGSPSEPTVWTSTNGHEWTRADTSADFGSGPVPLSLNSVVQYRRNVVVAAQDGQFTQMYSSRAGRRWRMVGTLHGVVAQLAVHGALVIAVGSTIDGTHRERATIWTSTDARRWHRAFASAAAPFADFTWVAVSGRSFVAAGYRGHVEPLVDAAVAVSTDGRTWTPVTRTGSTFALHTYFEAAAALGKHALVFGSETTGGTGAGNDPFTGGTVVYGN